MDSLEIEKLGETRMRLAICATALIQTVVFALPAWGIDAGDRLQWTGAVTQVEGSAGGGLVPWALIGGLETNAEVGASGFATDVKTEDFSLHAGGVSVDLEDRFELSVARQRFDAGAVIPGLTLGQDIVGAKVRLVGDAVFAPDEFLPQISLGAQWKHTLDFDQIPRAVGAARGEDVDLYLSATKLYFAALEGRNVIIDMTLRRTRANQFGLLGFGGDGRGYSYVPEGSIGIFVTESLLLGAEYRDKPNNLRAFREDSAEDVFLAWSPHKNVSVTAAWTDLGRIAGKVQQSGVYLSLWLGI
jgi:hypothetical protein